MGGRCSSACARVGPDSVVLVYPYDGGAAAPSGKLFELLESFPSVVVVVAIVVTPARGGRRAADDARRCGAFEAVARAFADQLRAIDISRRAA